MSDQGEHYEKSWILHHVLNWLIGSHETVSTRQRLTVLNEQIENGKKDGTKRFYTGSKAEGFRMPGSDIDLMFIEDEVIVTCPFQGPSIPPDSGDKTVCIMRNTLSRPGYVALQVIKLDRNCKPLIVQSIVQFGNELFISSELYRWNFANQLGCRSNISMGTQGPAVNVKNAQSRFGTDMDVVLSFPCNEWPKEAKEWVRRPRLHGWPDDTLRDQIAQGGCHLVPVGDKTSADMSLQWRISFATAERKLIHSFTHTQILIYGLLKYFAKEILSESLEQGDIQDIISSYILKTAMFYAVENTPGSFWQEKNTFYCFLFCLKILIAWVKAGHCPNYFVNSNNMFHGKVHGENQQKLLHFLILHYNMNWKCLFATKDRETSIGMLVDYARNGDWSHLLPTSTKSEMDRDMLAFGAGYDTVIGFDSLSVSLSLLFNSTLDIDVMTSYIATAQGLAFEGIQTFNQQISLKGNKGKYKSLRKSKLLLTPFAAVCTSPGQLTMATYHYQTGNYPKTLEICAHMLSQLKLYVGDGSLSGKRKWYETLLCGRGYNLLHKCKEAYASTIAFPQNTLPFWPSQIHLELTKITPGCIFAFPPLPYAVFLTFICYHELGDTRRRDAALMQLRTVKYDEEQGGGTHWIVQNLLGICYEMVGDKQRAVKEYLESLGCQTYQYRNPAMERIRRLEEVPNRQA